MLNLGDEAMLVNKKCPYCGTEQKGLDLTESDGSFICSKCERHFIVDNDNIKEITDEQSKNNGIENHA